MKKTTHSEEQRRSHKANDITQPLSKIGRTLSVFLSGESINSREEGFGDCSLSSTVFILANTHGLLFECQYRRVPNHSRREISYRLPASEHSHGHCILRRLKHARSSEEG